MSTIHIRPTAELAPRALLSGDPGRALLLAQELIDAPKMSNHHRGLWGYSGPAKLDGEPLSVQSTGMGGPSAAIVLEELIQLGLRRAIRVGTCGALDASLGFGDLVLARETIAADGVGRLLSAFDEPTVAPSAMSGIDEPVIAANPELAASLERSARPEADGRVVSTDVFYEPAGSEREARWIAAGAIAVEMEAAALFAIGRRHEVAVGCLLAVSDVLDATGREHADDDILTAAAVRMGEAAVAALG